MDAKGKNKQIFARVTFTYEQITNGIKEVYTAVVKEDGKIYNMLGQQVEPMQARPMYTCNGKKFIAR